MSRYVLSRVLQYEVGWVYRAEPSHSAPPDRYDLFNDLSSAPHVPAYLRVVLAPDHFREIPGDIYDAVITLCETGGQTSLDAALQLLAPFDEPPAGCTCLQTVTGEALHNAALEPPPFGPGFAAADLNGVDALEIWGSRFSTTAEDFVEYRLLRAGLCVKFRRFAGY